MTLRRVVRVLTASGVALVVAVALGVAVFAVAMLRALSIG